MIFNLFFVSVIIPLIISKASTHKGKLLKGADSSVEEKDYHDVNEQRHVDIAKVDTSDTEESKLPGHHPLLKPKSSGPIFPKPIRVHKPVKKPEKMISFIDRIHSNRGRSPPPTISAGTFEKYHMKLDAAKAKAENEYRKNYVLHFMEDHYSVTDFLYQEIQRIKSHRVVYDEVRQVIADVNASRNKTAITHMNECITDVMGWDVRTPWDNKANDLDVQVLQNGNFAGVH